MKYFYSYIEFINESLSSDTLKFEKKYSIKLDKTIALEYLDVLNKIFNLFDLAYINSIFSKITFLNLGAIHGEYDPYSKALIINPKIFKYKKHYGTKDNKYPSYIHTIIHEIGHAIDNYKLSLSPDWLAISDWKKHSIENQVPNEYLRYTEKRIGRTTDNLKLDTSDWIYKKNSSFAREYSKKSPMEDFADSFSFVILGFDDKFKGDTGQLKLKYIKNILKDKVKKENLKEL